jgi:HMG (high mobility group) box
MLFVKEERAHVRAELPGLSVPELGRELGRRWNLLGSQAKTPYETLARQ